MKRSVSQLFKVYAEARKSALILYKHIFLKRILIISVVLYLEGEAHLITYNESK